MTVASVHLGLNDNGMETNGGGGRASSGARLQWQLARDRDRAGSERGNVRELTAVLKTSSRRPWLVGDEQIDGEQQRC